MVRGRTLDGSYGFGGEESAGASFLRKDGTVWTTDKDGLIMDLLGRRDNGRHGQGSRRAYQELEAADSAARSTSASTRPPIAEQKAALKNLSPDMVATNQLGGEAITAKLTKAPGNNAPIGGLKVVAENGWFAARPSGTEDIYKIYAESFKGKDHLDGIMEEAQAIVKEAFAAAGV